MARGGKGLVYQPQFKQTAIELAISSSKPMSETAKELGVHPKTLMNWVYNYKKSNNIMPATNNTNNIDSALNDELKRLRKENARLKMECDILKKATAYFAKQTL